jgi:hypothetical protein
MENLIKTRIEKSREYNKREIQQQKEKEPERSISNTMLREQDEEDELQFVQQDSARGRTAKDIVKRGAPSGSFLRAAVRPFTYRNLVKEIVLMRHFIVDGEIV